MKPEFEQMLKEIHKKVCPKKETRALTVEEFNKTVDDQDHVKGEK